MKFKFNVLVAAVAVLAAGGAQAALETFGSGNSALTFIAYDRTGAARSSFMADLNFSLDQFLTSTAPTQTTTWNFNTNTITVGGVAQTGSTIDWSPFSSFFNTAQASELRWAVIGGDLVNQRFLSTGLATTAALGDVTPAAQAGATPNMVSVDNAYLANQSLGTHIGNDAGASVALTSGAANYLPVANRFGTADNWNGNLKWNATTANGGVSRFFYIDTQSRNAALNPDLPTIKIFGVGDMQAPSVIPLGAIDADVYSTFSYDQAAGVLTWQAAVVPEPGTYAMLLAGLGAVGFIARRRRQS